MMHGHINSLCQQDKLTLISVMSLIQTYFSVLDKTSVLFLSLHVSDSLDKMQMQIEIIL